jgi:hypothetical protein
MREYSDKKSAHYCSIVNQYLNGWCYESIVKCLFLWNTTILQLSFAEEDTRINSCFFKGGATAISIIKHFNRSRLKKSNQLMMELKNLNVTANMIPGVKFADQFFNI